MSIRSNLLLAGAGCLCFATPVFAQDEVHAHPLPDAETVVIHHDDAPLPGGGYDGAWQGEWVDDETYAGEWEGTYSRRHHRALDLPASPDGRLGYTLAQRQEWLADCTFMMSDYEGEDRAWAARYCETYLRRYEANGGGHGRFALGWGAPVMMMRAGGHRHGPAHSHDADCEVTVTEEWVDVDRPVPQPRPASVAPAPRPAPQGKLTEIK